MPWRAGRDFRHLYHAAHNILERSRITLHPICLIAKPLHFSPALWRPAAALQLNHSHGTATGSVQDSVDIPILPADEGKEMVSTILRWKPPSVHVDGGPPEVPPPPNILSIIDSVFESHPARLPTLADLKRSTATSELAPYLRLPQRAPALVHYLLGAKDHRSALWIIRVAVEGGYSFSPKFYGRVAETLAGLNKWKLIPGLMSFARERLGYTTTGLLNWRLQALTESRHYLSLQDALDMFTKDHVRPSRFTYHLVISMHLRNHDLHAAMASIRAMESAGFRVSSRTWAVILASHRSLGITPSARTQAMAALQTADDRTATAILNNIVQLLLDVHDMNSVVEVLSMVSQPRGDPRSAPGVDSIPEDGAVAREDLHPRPAPSHPSQVFVNVSTFNKLLTYLAQQADLERSMGILQQMQAADILPNGDTTTALMRLYFNCDLPNDALHIVADALRDFPAAILLLPRIGFSPTTPAEHPIYPRTASPTIRLFNTLIWGVLQAQDGKGLLGLKTALRMMQIANIDADATTVAILLSYLYRGESARPREMIRTVRALMSAGVAPTAQHLHVLVGAMLREERVVGHAVGWMVKSSPDRSSSPTGDQAKSDDAQYSHPTAGITFPRRLRYRALMRPIVQSLVDRGVRSDRVTFALRIKHDASVRRDLDGALASFRKMVECGMRPNEYHYGALMEGYTNAGDMRGAADLMREAADAGVRIDVKMHTILVAGYARLAQPVQALTAFRAMVALGIRPDVPAIDALVSAFFRARRLGAARRVLLKLWPQIAPISDELRQASLRELAVAFRALHGSKKVAPERLSSQEQRIMRWRLRDITGDLKVALGYRRRKGDTELRHARSVALTRAPDYTRAKTR
ncbi:hypothetical protein C2E23DRAFT_742054 [Lenzites betulinus]|nr:hypothetical protein C2E23DRAFT_742054 [Lenzites betulinus]